MWVVLLQEAGKRAKVVGATPKKYDAGLMVLDQAKPHGYTSKGFRFGWNVEGRFKQPPKTEPGYHVGPDRDGKEIRIRYEDCGQVNMPVQVVTEQFEVWMEDTAVTDDQGNTDTAVIVLDVNDEAREAGAFKYDPTGRMPPMSTEDLVACHLSHAAGFKLHMLVSYMRWVKGDFEKRPRHKHAFKSVWRPAEGSWNCPTSPTNTCWYDDAQDSPWDCCLFCGEPHERK